MTSARPWGVFYKKLPNGRWRRLSVYRTMELASIARYRFMIESGKGIEVEVRKLDPNYKPRKGARR